LSHNFIFAQQISKFFLILLTSITYCCLQCWCQSTLYHLEFRFSSPEPRGFCLE